jgi:hypothetical protein
LLCAIIANTPPSNSSGTNIARKIMIIGAPDLNILSLVFAMRNIAIRSTVMQDRS